MGTIRYSPLLALAAELQMEIYSYLLENTYKYIENEDRFPGFSLISIHWSTCVIPTPLLLSCRTINSIVQSLLKKERPIIVSDAHTNINHFLTRMLVDALSIARAEDKIWLQTKEPTVSLQVSPDVVENARKHLFRYSVYNSYSDSKVKAKKIQHQRCFLRDMIVRLRASQTINFRILTSPVPELGKAVPDYFWEMCCRELKRGQCGLALKQLIEMASPGTDQKIGFSVTFVSLPMLESEQLNDFKDMIDANDNHENVEWAIMSDDELMIARGDF